jgi:hypothetical protein
VSAPTTTRPAETADPLHEAIARARAAADRVRAQRGLGDLTPDDPRIAAVELGEPGDEGDIRAAQDTYERQIWGDW